MSRWGAVFRIAAATAFAYFAPAAWGKFWWLVAGQAETERQRRARDKANNRARAAYNEQQKDRLDMVDLKPDMARSLVLARLPYLEASRPSQNQDQGPNHTPAS